MNTRKPIVIAHRGASGYLPEHTLEAKALAHGMGADFIEQDVVLSRDGVPVILHDIQLDSTTDVADCYPRRARSDKHFYAIDFSLEELRHLRVHERCNIDAAGHRTAVYSERFPMASGCFTMPTLAEEIALIAGLDHSRNCRTGLYVELKSPNWHLSQGQDISRAVLTVLEEAGYADRSKQVFLQCFDDKTLRALRDEYQTELPLIQLIGENSWSEDSAVDYDYLTTDEGLSYVASYAQGIGPHIPHIYRGKTSAGAVRTSELVAQAQARGLRVHPYTFRREELPPGIENFSELLDVFIRQVGVDGLFTDFPDLVINYLQTHQS